MAWVVRPESVHAWLTCHLRTMFAETDGAEGGVGGGGVKLVSLTVTVLDVATMGPPVDPVLS